MALRRPSVDGPTFAKLMREVRQKVDLLESKAWDFGNLPEVFARDNRADVVAKELLHVFDGQRVTRLGRLVMGGYGTHFNLMGPIPSDSRIQVTDSTLLDQFNVLIGSKGLDDLPAYRKLGAPQQVEFFNYGMFYTLRQMVEWLLVHQAGCFPSTLENIVRHFARGDVVQNYNYSPARIGVDATKPVLMQAKCMSLSFPSRAMEWMDRPLFGGFQRDTFHVETLLTTKESKISHPYLPLDSEGTITLAGQHYYFKRFIGTAQKDGVRGDGVPEESPKKKRPATKKRR